MGAYNRNLLLHPTIQASMIETMIKDERQMLIFPLKHCSNLHTVNYTDLGNGKVTMRHVQDEDKLNSAINLNGGSLHNELFQP